MSRPPATRQTILGLELMVLLSVLVTVGVMVLLTLLLVLRRKRATASTRFLAVIAVEVAGAAEAMGSSVVVAEGVVDSEAARENSEDVVAAALEVDAERWASSVAVAAAATAGVDSGVALKGRLKARRKSLRAGLSGSTLIPQRQPAATSLGRTCLRIA
jgi:hypothetical protein